MFNGFPAGTRVIPNTVIRRFNMKHFEQMFDDNGYTCKDDSSFKMFLLESPSSSGTSLEEMSKFFYFRIFPYSEGLRLIGNQQKVIKVKIG